jgi:hypothetical protein
MELPCESATLVAEAGVEVREERALAGSLRRGERAVELIAEKNVKDVRGSESNCEHDSRKM